MSRERKYVKERQLSEQRRRSSLTALTRLFLLLLCQAGFSTAASDPKERQCSSTRTVSTTAGSSRTHIALIQKGHKKGNMGPGDGGKVQKHKGLTRVGGCRGCQGRS